MNHDEARDALVDATLRVCSARRAGALGHRELVTARRHPGA